MSKRFISTQSYLRLIKFMNLEYYIIRNFQLWSILKTLSTIYIYVNTLNLRGLLIFQTDYVEMSDNKGAIIFLRWIHLIKKYICIYIYIYIYMYICISLTFNFDRQMASSHRWCIPVLFLILLLLLKTY